MRALARREATAALLGLLASAPPPRPARAAPCDSALLSGKFRSAASSRPNYSSAITASRDTNVSPKEAYDIIAFKAELPARPESCPRALDLGAGAGVSTELLWENGFREIVAVDISRTAWDDNVRPDNLPAGVRFVQANDDAFVDGRPPGAPRFDMVVVNYAIDADKALAFAQALLTEEGRMLAPVNQARNYWFAQEFRLMDQGGAVLWRQDKVGAWEVTFQPDFTSPSCQGQWCPQFRGADSLSTLSLGKYVEPRGARQW